MTVVDKEIEKLKEEGFYLTEFNLVNPTTQPVVYDLFNTNTLSTLQTFPSAVFPASILGTSITPYTVASLFGMAFCPVNNNMYIPDADTTNSVLVVDINNNIVATIPAVAEPSGIVYNPVSNKMYLAVSSVAQVWVIDCSTNMVVNTINVGNSPSCVAYNSLNNTVYVTCNFSNNVYAINCFNDAVITSIPVANAPLGIAYCVANNSVYVATQSTNAVSVINCANNTIVGSPISVGVTPLQMVYNSINNVVYVAHDSTTDIYVIDCSNNTLLPVIPIGSRSLGLVFVPQFNYLYVSSTDTGEIYTINTANNVNSVVGSPVFMSTATLSIGYNPVNNVLYVSGFAAQLQTLVPAVAQVSYVTGSFNYNQFIQDIQDNPILVKCALIVSSNESNISQVFFTTVKNANGQSASVPRYPQLSVSTNQMQSSVSKVCFGEGFVLDVESFFSNFTVNAVSSIKLILIQKQTKKSDSLGNENDTCNKLNLIRNVIQEVKGVDAFNNIEFYQITQVQPIRPKRPIKHETPRPISVKPSIKPVIEQVRPIEMETPRQFKEPKMLKK